MGYLNKENETKQVINSEDNWLKLGDLGYTDLEGFTVVFGKSEDFITLKSEEVVSPLRVKQNYLFYFHKTQKRNFPNYFRLSNWSDLNYLA